MSRLKKFSLGLAVFLVTSIAISLFRYWFTFKQLCGVESGVPNGPQGLMGCPGFLEVFLITSISPGFFFLSVLTGLVLVYIYGRAK